MITRETTQLLRLITFPLLVVDAKGQIVFANPPLCELLGKERSRLIGRPLSDFSVDAPQKTLDMLRLFSGSGDWLVGSLSLRKTDGTVEHFPCKGALLQQSSDEHPALIAIQLDRTLRFQALTQQIDDLNREIRIRRQVEELLRERTAKLESEIAERKQAEEQLRAVSHYVRSLIEASLDPLVTISAEGMITDVNAAFELATGIDREKLIGTDFNRYFTEPEKAREGYLKVFSDNLVKDYPLAIRHTSGRVMDVLYNATVFRNEAGEVQGVFAAARDITERKRAEDALRESEERFRTVADFTYDWEYWQGPNHEMWFITPSCERITGYSREEFIAQPDLVDRIIHPDDRGLMEQHLNHVRHEDSSPLDFRIVRKDGGIRWIAHGCRAVYWHGDKFMGRRSSNRDITERKNLEMELGELNQDLKRRVEEEVAKNREKDHILIQQSRLAAMGEMVHNIAHQWRQPLNALSIILSNIKDDYDYHELTSESLGESVLHARQLLQRMSTTVDDFRDFFRPDREPGEFDMSQSVEDALFVMEASLKNNNIQVEKNLPKGLMVYGYSNQFAQTILNIFANAKEAIQQRKIPDGRIEISLSRSGNKGLLAIQDNGGGIADDVLPKIFDPYFTTKEKGSGIGLYMSKMIIERNLNGTIAIVNQGAGALVTITLPLQAPA